MYFVSILEPLNSHESLYLCVFHSYDEDVFLSPVSNNSTIRRLGSQDSGNGNGPSTSTSGDSDDITCISALPAPTAASSGTQTFHLVKKKYYFEYSNNIN